MPSKRKPTKKQRAYETSGEKRKTEDGEKKELKKNRRQSVTEPMRSNFTQVLCRDVRVCFFEFLGPKDQASLRAVSKDSSIDFNHAVQRGYVPVVVCDEYVKDANEIHQDGEDGHPKLHFGPGDRKNLFAPDGADWGYNYKMQRSEKDKNATLIVNVAKMLGKGETKLQDRFLYKAQFKAVHFVGTEPLEEIGNSCLYGAQNLACFTMSAPCPKLKRVSDRWLADCWALTTVCFKGCTALESVGNRWLWTCTALESVNFEGCSALRNVGGRFKCVRMCWLAGCTKLHTADFTALVSLKTVGLGWLSDCSSLKIANFAGCSALGEVGEYWMYYCESLDEVRLGACASLRSIGQAWLDGCPSLRRVVLPSDTELPDDIVERVKKYLE